MAYGKNLLDNGLWFFIKTNRDRFVEALKTESKGRKNRAFKWNGEFAKKLWYKGV